MTGKAVVGYSGDSAGLEEVLRVGRARREVGKASEVGEEDFRACTGSFEHTVGSIAQRFEGLGEAKAGEGLLSSPLWGGVGGGGRRMGHRPAKAARPLTPTLSPQAGRGSQ